MITDGADEWFRTIVDDYADNVSSTFILKICLRSKILFKMLEIFTYILLASVKRIKGRSLEIRWLEYDGSEQCEPLLRDAHLFEMIKWFEN